MKLLRELYRLEVLAMRWMREHAALLSRLSLGVIFIWFGILKPLGLSPASELVAATIPFGMDPDWVIPVLGWWEVAIGVCFLDPVRWVAPRSKLGLTRVGLVLLALQMPATFLPIVVLPEAVFTAFPYGLTMEGQYIVKNLALISAAMVVGGSRVRRREGARARSRTQAYSGGSSLYHTDPSLSTLQ